MILVTLKPRRSVLHILVSYWWSLLLESHSHDDRCSLTTLSVAPVPAPGSGTLALPQLSLGTWMKLSLYKLGDREWIKHFSKVRASEHLEGRVKFFILLYH